VTIDRELLRLAYTPFVRASYIARVERLVARYTLALAPEENKATLLLLKDHPSALYEKTALDRVLLEQRLESARIELANLRAAAPLPPPSDRTERAIVLAFADLEHYMLEMRWIRRMLRRVPPLMLLDEYKTRRDPLDPIDVELVRAIARIRRATLLKTCATVAGLRYQVSDLRRLLAPARADGPKQEKVFLCKIGELGEGCAKKLDAFGRTIAVFKNRGAVYAIDDECPHRGGPLHQGDVEKGAAICPLHGWAFDLATGEMRGNPKVKVPTYEVDLRDDSVFIGPQKK
jgi:nitrite reductase/ring-hydroxylating ferredoxin subunit